MTKNDKIAARVHQGRTPYEALDVVKAHHGTYADPVADGRPGRVPARAQSPSTVNPLASLR